MKKQVLYLLAVIAVAAMVFVTGCQKEESFEGSNTPAKGDLQDDVTGDCLPKSVNGVYAAGTPLVPATNTITVQVNVTQTGTYVVTTDTVNGIFFRATGTFTALGPTTVTLRGNGTPFAQGTHNFVVSFDGTICDIQVTVLPAGAGAAVYTMNCAGATVNGTYTSGTALTASNTITIPITVTTAGSYTLTASINGMTFTNTGTLTTGTTSITLNGTGTPSMAGTFNLVVGSCTIAITVAPGAGAAVYTLNCAGATVQGTYTAGTALTASNTITIPITLTTPGTYSITTAPAVNGMIFANSGTLTAGTTTITLIGTGTPTASGTFNFTAGSCTIPVTVSGGAAANYTINCGSAVVKGAYVVNTGLVAVTNYVDITVNVISTGTYPAITATGGGMTFTKAAGTFTATGNQTIRLDGSGTAPAATGNQAVTFAGSCSFNVYVVANDYFPRTNGSNWSYEFDDNSVPADTLYRNATASTISALGNTWTIFIHNDGVTPPPDSGGYYRRSGGDYYEWFDYVPFFGYDAPAEAWAQYIMVKDNVAAGTNWKSGGMAGTYNGPPPQNLNVRFSFTVTVKDQPLTVTTSAGAAVYQNVITVEEKYEVEVSPGVWQDVTSQVGYGKSYYARGVGLIMYESFDGSGALQFKQELRRWQVF